MVNALAGLSAGMDFTQGLQNTFDNSRLKRLAGMAYEAPQEQRQSLLGKMAAIDPQAAQTQQQQFQSDDDRKMKQVVGAARYMKSAMNTNNPAALAGAWRAVRPGLIRAGLATEDELSPDWDPSYAETVHQVLAMGDPNASGSVLQSQKIGADGYIYNSFRDGRMVNTGVKADRQAWFRDQPGIPAGIVDKSGTFTPLGELGGDPSGAIYEDGQPVATTTAVDASGVPVNIGNDIPADARAAILAGNANGVQSNGFMPINRVAGAGAGTTGTATRPSAAQDAAATERARQEVQLQYLPAELNARTDAAIRQARGTEMAKGEADRANQQATRTRDAGTALDLISEARRLLPGATGGGLGAAADATAGFFGHATEGAQANAALKTIAGQMTSKMPRMEGPQSDRDVQMYKDMAGDVGNANLPVRIRLAALDQIERLNQKYANNPSGRSGPAVGVVEDGYRFKGGNPADPNNWERM